MEAPTNNGNHSLRLPSSSLDPRHHKGNKKLKWKSVKTALLWCLTIGIVIHIAFYVAILLSVTRDDDVNQQDMLLKGGIASVKDVNNNNAIISNGLGKNKKENDKDENKDNILTAYIEPIDPNDWGIKPLPTRNTTSNQLQKIEYPQLNSCSRLLEQFPTDDAPIDEDPFLPWIHDVFPTHDGKYIQFVAQNKRRCRTGKNEQDIIIHMDPQAALFQHVPVKRIKSNEKENEEEVRYRLSSHEEADIDGMATRFICRFKPSLQETLSVHNVNYEYHAYRKTHKTLFHFGGPDLNSIYTSQLLFKCPVPKELQQGIRDGSTVINDYATMFLDLIPIRTPLRFGKPDRFLPPPFKEEQRKDQDAFDPMSEWGTQHVLPRVQDSGRWSNIPICKPSLMEYEPTALQKIENENLQLNKAGHGPKTHRLIACVWASAEYHTRGERFNIKDGRRRLKEWLTYNFLTGFDHVYVYDNSAAHTNNANLKDVADEFGEDRVTHIPWNAKICNNRPNNVDSPGERSSQYAAEASCKLRFGEHAEWIGGFDIDEYLVPMGKYTSVPQILDMMEDEGLKMINFASYRAWPRRVFINEPVPLPRSMCGRKPCFDLSIPTNRTILQAYNCDRQPPGVKVKRMPAEKQLYYSDYVKLHFVHYSEITELSQLNKTGMIDYYGRWTSRIGADPYSRFSDEINEGTMLHTKAVAHQDTADWEYVCMHNQGFCRLGNPYPPGAYEGNITEDDKGYSYNCFVNEKIENYWVPRLLEANPFLG